MIALLIRVIFYISSAGLIGIVLVQMSEHAGIGGAFGAGGSSTVFGRDEQTDPKRTATSVLAATFMISSLLLSII
ncbi:MAG: preprotein translocase subunit SecG [Candidatus Acetothermia bacterium]